MLRDSIIVDDQCLKYLKAERDGAKYNYKDIRTRIVNGCYHVYPVGISDNQVYICCPYCKEFHAHGKINGDYTGHRMPHCEIEYKGSGCNNGYYIDEIVKERTND